ncbi:MAG: ABC transporter ATP-binding protein [Phycisphaerales bacterium]|nr:ABC transporter ATP-binding protein [Phycisphaerales bacterium]
MDSIETDHGTADGLPVLAVDNLTRHFRTGRRGIFGGRRLVRAVDGISFEIRKGEVFGIVGESGCGKSSCSKAILNIHPPQSGTVRLDGIELTKLSAREWRQLRRRIQYVFQDPLSALDPRISVINQVIEPLIIHDIGSRSERRRKAMDLLLAVGLQSDQSDKFPHELSGGQRQRVVLARALVLDPHLIICDEPVSALDVSIQAQVIQLMRRLRDQLALTILFISHDLSLVRFLCDRVAVMYLGQIVELARTRDLFARPQHPYTQALISAIPIPMPGARREQILLEGEPPSPINPPVACRFHPRCRHAAPLCRQVDPALKRHADDRLVACHWAHGELG